MRAVLLATLAGIILGALGPFGSYLDGGILLRSAYWSGSMWLGLLLYGGGIAIGGRVSIAGSWSRWAFIGLSVPVASIPEAEITRLAAFLIWPDLHRYGPGWWLWYAQTTTIGAIAVLGATMALHARSGRTLPMRLGPPPTARGEDRIVPPGDRSVPRPLDVIALQMEDHYVRVHDQAGSTLLHMPLTRAIEQVALLDGLRIHRSWWVARHAVARVEGSPRSMRLQLSNGLSAPVARSAVTALRQAGWLETGPPA